MENEGKPLKRPQKPAATARPATRSSKGRLGPEVQTKIGQHLRRLYSDVVNEGVPERFAELLRDLDKTE
jgi:hypothetical protein